MFGRQAAAGLRAWSLARAITLRIEDDRSLPAESARLVAALASRTDLLFGPYGSGSGRAVAEAMAGRPEVIWNHGAAAVARTGARIPQIQCFRFGHVASAIEVGRVTPPKIRHFLRFDRSAP